MWWDTESGHCQGACRSQWFFYVPLQVSETAPPFYVVMRATRDTQSPMTVMSVAKYWAPIWCLADKRPPPHLSLIPDALITDPTSSVTDTSCTPSLTPPYPSLTPDVPITDSTSSYAFIVEFCPSLPCTAASSFQCPDCRGNIPGNTVDEGEVLCDYLQPFPPRGTGLHRHIFLLFKQSQRLDYSDIKRKQNWWEYRHRQCTVVRVQTLTLL